MQSAGRGAPGCHTVSHGFSLCHRVSHIVTRCFAVSNGVTHCYTLLHVFGSGCREGRGHSFIIGRWELLQQCHRH
jgi:hypothetical protein